MRPRSLAQLEHLTYMYTYIYIYILVDYMRIYIYMHCFIIYIYIYMFTDMYRHKVVSLLQDDLAILEGEAAVH